MEQTASSDTSDREERDLFHPDKISKPTTASSDTSDREERDRFHPDEISKPTTASSDTSDQEELSDIPLCMIIVPFESWTREYFETVLRSNEQHLRRWRALVREEEPLPPRKVRYVSASCYRYVAGPILTKDILGETLRTVIDASGNKTPLRSKIEKTVEGDHRYVCCVNRCCYISHTICRFCAYFDRRGKDPVVQSCLCDCLTFQYCMLWRGEYIRRMSNRYTVEDTYFFQYVHRVKEFEVKRKNGELTELGTEPFSVLVLTKLVASFLASMGFAPSSIVQTRSTVRKAIRCYRCFSAITITDVKVFSFTSPLIVDNSDTVTDDKMSSVNSFFREINRLHGRANPYCPYVLRPFDNPFSQLISETYYNNRFQSLTLYRTRFNMPSSGRLWNRVYAEKDALFEKNLTRHFICREYIKAFDVNQLRSVPDVYRLLIIDDDYDIPVEVKSRLSIGLRPSYRTVDLFPSSERSTIEHFEFYENENLLDWMLEDIESYEEEGKTIYVNINGVDLCYDSGENKTEDTTFFFDRDDVNSTIRSEY